MTMTFGLFEYQVLGLNAMNIDSPLLSDLPIFTSWWCVSLLSIIIEFIIIFVYRFINNKKNAND